jgi:hypothetical protein
MILLTYGKGRTDREERKKGDALLRDCDFQKDVLLAGEERDSRQPIFTLDGFAGCRPVARWKNPRSRSKLEAGDPSANGTRGDPNFGVVSDAFVFAGVTAGHHVKPVIFFTEPDRSVDRTAILAERGKRYVFLALDFRRNRHEDIVRRREV